jgi:hypothetical protein
MGHSAIYDATHNAVVVFGGFVSASVSDTVRTNQVRILDLNTQYWRVLPSPASVPAVAFHT